MKQIKTIIDKLYDTNYFDHAVNGAIADGWHLTKRKVLWPKGPTQEKYMFPMLYAELEREVITDADRCCENCKHFEKSPDAAPCRDCSDDIDKWEAQI